MVWDYTSEEMTEFIPRSFAHKLERCRLEASADENTALQSSRTSNSDESSDTSTNTRTRRTSNSIKRNARPETSGDCSRTHNHKDALTNTTAESPGIIIPNRVFVGGLTPETTELNLHDVFYRFGYIKFIKIIYDRNGVSKGYGFVTFQENDDALRLQSEFKSMVIKGAWVTISQAMKKTNPSKSSDPSATPLSTQLARMNAMGNHHTLLGPDGLPRLMPH